MQLAFGQSPVIACVTRSLVIEKKSVQSSYALHRLSQSLLFRGFFFQLLDHGFSLDVGNAQGIAAERADPVLLARWQAGFVMFVPARIDRDEGLEQFRRAPPREAVGVKGNPENCSCSSCSSLGGSDQHDSLVRFRWTCKFCCNSSAYHEKPGISAMRTQCSSPSRHTFVSADITPSAVHSRSESSSCGPTAAPARRAR